MVAPLTTQKPPITATKRKAISYPLFSGGLNHYFSVSEDEVSRIQLSTLIYQMESQAGERLNTTRELWFNYWGFLQSWVRVGFRDRDRIARRFNQSTLDVTGNAIMENERQWILRTESSLLKNMRFIFEGRFGTAIDTDNYRVGDLIEIEPELRWNARENLEIFLKNSYRSLDVAEGEVFEENYLRFGLTYQLERGSFFRLTLIDDLVFQNPDLYLYEDVSRKERDTSMEILFAYKPTQLNTFLIGMNTNTSDDSEREEGGLDWDEVSVFVKYSRSFDLR